MYVHDRVEAIERLSNKADAAYRQHDDALRFQQVEPPLPPRLQRLPPAPLPPLHLRRQPLAHLVRQSHFSSWPLA